MELIFGRQKIDYEKTTPSVEIIEKINELLTEGNFFSHLISDGTEIYEDHEDYLNLNLDRITKLEIIAKTEKEFINDVMISAEDYLERAKPELAALPESFYNNPTNETWTNFEMLLEGAQWLSHMLKFVVGSKERPENWGVYTELLVAMQEELAKLGQELENKDYLQIGNIIRDGIVPNFAALEVEIRHTNDTEGVRENLN